MIVVRFNSETFPNTMVTEWELDAEQAWYIAYIAGTISSSLHPMSKVQITGSVDKKRGVQIMAMYLANYHPSKKYGLHYTYRSFNAKPEW